MDDQEQKDMVEQAIDDAEATKYGTPKKMDVETLSAKFEKLTADNPIHEDLAALEVESHKEPPTAAEKLQKVIDIAKLDNNPLSSDELVEQFEKVVADSEAAEDGCLSPQELAELAETTQKEIDAEDPLRTVKRPIVYYPNPILDKRAKLVKHLAGINEDGLIDDMLDTLLAGKGLGLSAQQVGVDQAVFITAMGSDAKNLKVYINPQVEVLGNPRKWKIKSEGCLSFPGILIRTKRAATVRVRGWDLDGNDIDETLEGLEAQVVQHEMNHLEGITLATRMTDVQRICCRKGIKALTRIEMFRLKAEALKLKAEAAALTAQQEADDLKTEPIIEEASNVVDQADLY